MTQLLAMDQYSYMIDTATKMADTTNSRSDLKLTCQTLVVHTLSSSHLGHHMHWRLTHNGPLSRLFILELKVAADTNQFKEEKLGAYLFTKMATLPGTAATTTKIEAILARQHKDVPCTCDWTQQLLTELTGVLVSFHKYLRLQMVTLSKVLHCMIIPLSETVL